MQRPKPRGYPLTPKTWGEWIRKFRMDKCMTIPQTAKILGVTIKSIILWEHGVNCPRACHIPNIINFIGHDPFLPSGDFVSKVKHYRITHGYTRCELAKILQLEESVLARWENHRTVPSERLKIRVQNIIGLR